MVAKPTAPPARAHGPARRPARRLARWVAIVAAVVTVALVVCRFAIGWVFPVASGSMEPTIMTDEVVFLRYADGAPERYDIVVFTDVGGGASVKRAVAVPGDRFLIEPTGDLRINGAFLPDAPGRPPLVPMFDSRLQSIGEHWRHGGTAADPWSLAEGSAPGLDEVWEMDGSAVGRGADLGLLGLHDRIDDGRLLPSGEPLRGRHTVHDVAVSFEVMVLEPGGRIRVQVTEQGDVFEASAPVFDGQAETQVYVFRRLPGVPEPDFLGQGSAAIPIGEWVPVRFSNVDNRVTFSIAELDIVRDYERNTPHPTAFDLRPVSLGERVRLGGEGIALRVRRIRVERDFHVVPRGDHAVEREILLGPDQVFVLGDASGDSFDSRERGPVELSRIFGRAEAVVWPLRAARVLR